MGNRAEGRIRRGEGGILPEGGWGECGPRRLFAPKKVHVFSRRLRSEGVQGASGKPPASNIRRSLCRKQSPMVGPDAPTPALEKGCCPWALYCFGWRSEGGAGGRAESHPASMTRDNFAVSNFPMVGSDAPTPARSGTCRPKGRSHFSFGGERKVCKRKPAARRLQRRPAPLRVAGFVLR